MTSCQWATFAIGGLLFTLRKLSAIRALTLATAGEPAGDPPRSAQRRARSPSPTRTRNQNNFLPLT